MQNLYQYKPVHYFLTVLLISEIMGFAAAYLSHKQEMPLLQLIFMIIGLCAPFAVALAMIYSSKNKQLQQDFLHRLNVFNIKLRSFWLIVLLMPIVLLLATIISLFFGYSVDQFNFSPAFDVWRGQSLLGLLIVFLAPLLEELGWRGYGVDSLRSRFNLFTTSLLLTAILALWHLPLFFIKDYYQYILWQTSIIYSINFFVSILPATILLNWFYYQNNRNIIAPILFHGMLNLFSVLFQTEQFTKCILTILLLLISIVVIIQNRKLFFTKRGSL